jgi:exopolysaccharide biosynthesis polyprenyl glycosylphosphotransferase
VLYHNVQVMGHLLRAIDAAVIAAASAGTLWYVHVDAGSWLRIVAFCVALVVCFALVAERLHVYFVRRTEDLPKELLALCEVVLYAVGLACAATEIAGFGLSGADYLKALAAAIVMLLSTRIVMRFTIRRLRRRGDDYRVWIIVGRNERAADLAETILVNPHFGIRIEEIVDLTDREGVLPVPSPRFARAPLASLKSWVLQGTDEIREIVLTRVVDEVVITLPVRSFYDRIHEIVEICSQAGISVKLQPEVFTTPGARTEVSHVGKIAMVTHYSGPSNYQLLIAKRIIDVIGAAAALLVLSPLLLGIAIGVKLTSPGSVFFIQTRVGLHGRLFRMVKFRSMVQNAVLIRDELTSLNERNDGIGFKIRNDARITPLGRWLRKYRLDELPQLWNVLVGDMSLVGPRPWPVKEAYRWEWWHRRRLTMPPGLTCFWQVADQPTMPTREWMQLDIDYIDRWSLWLDLKLILLTLAAVAKGRGW